MAQQTAVEFYDQSLRKCLMGTVECDPMQILEQAKAIEKQQAIEHFISGSQWSIFPDDTPIDKIAEQYYNETYNK